MAEQTSPGEGTGTSGEPLGTPLPTGVPAPAQPASATTDASAGSASETLGVPAPAGGRRRRRGPSRAAEPVPPRHRALVIGLVVSALLIGLAALGGYLVNKAAPEVVETQTMVATRPPFEMVLPLQIGEYSRDANQGASPTRATDGKITLSATYSKGGQPAFVLLAARPYADGKVFMRDLNMNVVTAVDDGLCGISGDNNNDGCSLIRDNTGILVLSTVDMSRTDLMALTKQAATQMAGS